MVLMLLFLSVQTALHLTLLLQMMHSCLVSIRRLGNPWVTRNTSAVHLVHLGMLVKGILVFLVPFLLLLLIIIRCCQLVERIRRMSWTQA